MQTKVLMSFVGSLVGILSGSCADAGEATNRPSINAAPYRLTVHPTQPSFRSCKETTFRITIVDAGSVNTTLANGPERFVVTNRLGDVVRPSGPAIVYRFRGFLSDRS